MPLQLIEPRGKYLLSAGVVGHDAVMGHLLQVLKAFANKPEYKKFYIGITNDLETRLREHQRKKPDFLLMVPIYEEQAVLVENSFDRLEREAISAFRSGIEHPVTHQILLRCDNGPGGAPPKQLLYILVG